MLKMIAASGTALMMAALTPAQAQTVLFSGMPGADALPHGANGVFHGNYCGVGDNGPGLPPTDALDAACMHHDACTPSGQLPSCACNAQFLSETRAVATGSGQPEDLRALATLVEAAIPAIPCH